MPELATFLAQPPRTAQNADALILPLPIEKTVCYGTGTSGGPNAILKATSQLELFDEETLVDFAKAPRVATLPPVSDEGSLEECLARISQCVRALRDKFVLSLGGEHAVTYGVIDGLVDDLSDLTIVQIDAHADLADKLLGKHWSHGTVMRRLWERGCRLVQIGIRSLSSAEHELASRGDRITTYYAHQHEQRWPEMLDVLRNLRGDVYLTIDVDGLDPSIVPSTGTPMPDGLSWRQTIEVIATLIAHSPCRLIGADIVEFVPSPNQPGCDPVPARLAAKLLAWWWSSSRL